MTAIEEEESTVRGRVLYDLFEAQEIDKVIKGSRTGVTSYMDQKLKCIVYRISGETPSSSSILLPSTLPSSHSTAPLTRTTTNSLSITHKYIYVVFKPSPGQYFIIHLDCITQDQLLTKLSVSNIFHQLQCDKRTTLQIPFLFHKKEIPSEIGTVVQATPTPDNARWCVLVFNLPELFHQYFTNHYGYLKSVQLCANMAVKGIYSSNLLLTTDSLSYHLSLPVTNGLKYSDLYDHIVLPCKATPTLPVHHRGESINIGQSIVECNNEDMGTKPVPPILLKQQQPKLPQMTSTEVIVEASHSQGRPPSIIMTNITGIGPCYKGHINQLGNRIYYCCNSVIIAANLTHKQQEFFIGHSHNVCCIDVNDDLLVSSDVKGLIMLWNIASRECIGVIKTSSTCYISLSCDGKMLCCLGEESQNRSTLVLYNVPELTKITSHTSSIAPRSSIIKFISPTIVVACGLGHIRICRVKDDCLKIAPVVINQFHDCIFTDIATSNINNSIIYVSAANGCVFQVDVNQHSLLKVWSVFPNAPVVISSLSCSEEYCILGCADGILRVWPLDFSMVVMETDLQYPIMSVGVANSTFLCITETSVGILDTDNQSYISIMRGATSEANINDVIMTANDTLITSTDDGYIQIRSLLNKNELVYQFKCVNDVPTCLCCVSRSLFCIGSSTGTIRFVSVIEPMNNDQEHIHIAEQRCNYGCIVGVASLRNGERVYAATKLHYLLMFDTSDSVNDYPLLKYIGNSACVNGCLAVSVDDSKLASCSVSDQYNTAVITFYNTLTLNKISSIARDAMPRPFTIKTCSIIQLRFTADGELLILSDNGEILRYDGSRVKAITPDDSTSEVVPVTMDCNSSTGTVMIGNNDGSLAIINEGVHEEFIAHREAVHKVIIGESYLVSITRNEVILWEWHPSCTTPPTSFRAKPRPLVLSLSQSSTNTSSLPPDESSHNTKSCDSSNDVLKSYDSNDDVVKSCDGNDDVINADQLLHPSIGSEAILLEHIIGYTGTDGRGFQWCPSKGLLCYVCGCVIILEYLQKSHQQIFLKGHRNQVMEVTLLGDGRGLASTSSAKGNWRAEIRIWNHDFSWTCTKVIKNGPSSLIKYRSLAFSPDGRYLLAIGVNSNSTNNLLLWCCTDYSLLSATPVNYSLINMIAWDPISAYEFVTVGVAGIAFWLLEEEGSDVELKIHIPPNQQQGSTIISYNKDHGLFVGFENGMVSKWNTEKNTLIKKWSTGLNKIVALSSYGNRLAVGGDKCVQLWDTNRVILPEQSINIPGTIETLVFNQQLQIGIVGTVDHTLCVIDWNEGADPINLVNGHHGSITCIDVYKDNRIITSDNLGTMKVWPHPLLQSTDMECIMEFTAKNKDCVGALAPPKTATPSIVICGCTDGKVTLINHSKQTEHHKTFILAQSKMTKILRTDGLLVSGYNDGIVLINSVSNGSRLATITDHHRSPITDLNVSQEKISIAGVSIHSFHVLVICSADGRISVWKLSHTPSMIDWISLPTKTNKTKCAVLAKFLYPDIVIFTGPVTSLCYYSLTQKKVIKEHKLRHSVSCMCLSHDYQLIAIGSHDEILTIMDTNDGGSTHATSTIQEYHTHHGVVSNAIFNPSDTHLITSSEHCFQIWKVVNNY